MLVNISTVRYIMLVNISTVRNIMRVNSSTVTRIMRVNHTGCKKIFKYIFENGIFDGCTRLDLLEAVTKKSLQISKVRSL